MKSSLPDLTAQLEPIHRLALHTIAKAAAEVNADWFLTGAMARDWVFTLIHGIDTIRATKDADIGIALAGWDEFERVRTHIIAGGEFDADRSLHRLTHRRLKGFHIDLVPFGQLSGDKTEIVWPPNQDIVMNIIGFAEAFKASITVMADVDLPVKVASPAGMMLMKIFAWEDRKHLQPTGKDAQDIRLLLTRYEHVAGRSLYDVVGLMEIVDYDADFAAARLLGRDVAEIIPHATRAALLMILDRELSPNEAGLLIEQLSRGQLMGGIARDDEFQQMRLLLTIFRAGLDE
jgi:predicted nucleotidyltransferase